MARSSLSRARKVGESAAGVLCGILALAAVPAFAQTPETLLSTYREVAVAGDPRFPGFSAERGRAFYFAVRDGPHGKRSCASCHGPDPLRSMDGHSGDARADCPACHLTPPDSGGGRPTIRREIKPLSPRADPARFTDAAHTELWFDVNCFYVLGRGCTAQEKGDLLTYLLSLR